MTKEDEHANSKAKKGKEANKLYFDKSKRKALYGQRASSKIFESATLQQKRPTSNGNKATNNAINSEQKTWKEKIIIPSESKKKAIFDMFIMGLVLYSCVNSMFYASFSQPAITDGYDFQFYFDLMVELFFWLDLCLNFLQSYPHPEFLYDILEFKEIAKNYVFKGWFFVDFVSVFPFELFFTQGNLTKLVRLMRLPRLNKLIDISRFSQLIKSLMANSSNNDEKIVT